MVSASFYVIIHFTQGYLAGYATPCVCSDWHEYVAVSEKNIFSEPSTLRRLRYKTLCFVYVQFCQLKRFSQRYNIRLFFQLIYYQNLWSLKTFYPRYNAQRATDEFEAGRSDKYLTKTGKPRRKSLFHLSLTFPLYKCQGNVSEHWL